MSPEQLTQSEVDALLNGNNAHVLTDAQKDAIGEIGNISLGSGSTSMSTLLQQRVEITTPQVFVKPAEELTGDFGDTYLIVSIEYTEGLEGNNVLVIRGDDAKKIANLMLGGDGTDISEELDELHTSAVSEIMNQMMGSAATSMSTIFNRSVNISPPAVEVRSKDDMALGLSGWFIVIEFQLQVGDLIDSTLLQLVPYEFGVELINELLNPVETQQEAPSEPIVQEKPQIAPAPATAPVQHQVQVPSFARFEEEPASRKSAPRNLELLFDVDLSVRAELGTTKKSIREILDLMPGSIVELDKLAGEPIDVYVNNRKIGIGEVVVIDEKFGIRITDIVNQEERIKRFR